MEGMATGVKFELIVFESRGLKIKSNNLFFVGGGGAYTKNGLYPVTNNTH